MATYRVLMVDPSTGNTRQVDLETGSGGGNGVQVVVDFGTDGTGDASAVVTGLTWATAAMVFVCTVLSEEARIQGLQANVSDIVDGVGFTVHVHAPLLATGEFTVNCIGV